MPDGLRNLDHSLGSEFLTAKIYVAPYVRQRARGVGTLYLQFWFSICVVVCLSCFLLVTLYLSASTRNCPEYHCTWARIRNVWV